MQTYYLEYSDDEVTGTAHKFYEATVDGAALTLRYGRIGTPGASSTQHCPSPEAATSLALKKVNEKKRKGYAEAVPGVRQKRTMTRRLVESRPATTKKMAPTRWRFNTGSPAFGIFVDAHGCWMGNQDGRVYRLSHEGELELEFQLSEGVKCIVSDGAWLYVGCDDGNVYDLSGKTPRLAYEINPHIDIYWLDIANGLLAVADAGGQLTTVNYEDEEQWAVKTGGNCAWMVRCDAVGRVYYGDSQGVRCYYGWEQETLVWYQPTKPVLFGWLDGAHVYAATAHHQVLKFDQAGQLVRTYQADAAVFSCATSPDGRFVFAGDSYSTVYCFAEDGQRLWKLATGCGSACSMQYVEERLYLVTSNGAFACLDVSPAALAEAEQGLTAPVTATKAPQERVATVPSHVLESAPAALAGVQLRCVRVGSQLRVRVASAGYQDWYVQFPKNLRQEGQRYLVEQVEPAAHGHFYRILGNIYMLPT
ncbi:WGR domain-containing protein [Hymenobacter sp. HDW8]|uniref:WGR domain-containing protein n=1 Tax=Hymenobacter sp. HDW8 TaxID=2714932 RepID=UPI00140AF3FA|nr:WGR domain-containing protein [Hymenobacter sp. HDW8]QIL78310.1 WGR domain-containing protein [Hymenobacter sp. HDW8]